MVINGKNVALDKSQMPTLGAYLKNANYNLETIAVEKNGVIVNKKDFDSETICEDDVIEIVCFVGGG